MSQDLKYVFGNRKQDGVGASGNIHLGANCNT